MGLILGWRPAGVLLDRDGTLNRKAPEGTYVRGPGEVEMIPGAAAAVARLTAAGVRVAVVTNQRGVALGVMSDADVEEANEAVAAVVTAAGGRVDGWYVCPHEAGTCGCRKPDDGLVRRALAAWGLPGPACAVVGDRETDVLAGVPRGLVRVLISARPPAATVADAVVPDLASAVDLLLLRPAAGPAAKG